MDFDTGSSDIWVPSMSCGVTCGTHRRFNPEKSSTYVGTDNKTWALRYGDGSNVIGYTGKDIVHLGNVSQPNQLIGLVTKETAQFASDRYLDGIFGLAFPPLAFTNINNSIVEELYLSGSIPAPIVSFHLGRYQDGGKGEVVKCIPTSEYLYTRGTNFFFFLCKYSYLVISIKTFLKVNFDTFLSH